jgi:hypothetical protein
VLVGIVLVLIVVVGIVLVLIVVVGIVLVLIVVVDAPLVDVPLVDAPLVDARLVLRVVVATLFVGVAIVNVTITFPLTLSFLRVPNDAVANPPISIIIKFTGLVNPHPVDGINRGPRTNGPVADVLSFRCTALVASAFPPLALTPDTFTFVIGVRFLNPIVTPPRAGVIVIPFGALPISFGGLLPLGFK